MATLVVKKTQIKQRYKKQFNNTCKCNCQESNRDFCFDFIHHLDLFLVSLQYLNKKIWEKMNYLLILIFDI